MQQPKEEQRQLTWLQKQQLKLKSKQVDQFQQKRNVVEKQLIAELKSTMERNGSGGGGGGAIQEEGTGQSSLLRASAHSSHCAPTPAVPLRTSSRNILMQPLYAEEAELGQPVRTLSLHHSPAQLPLLSNGNGQANYQLVSSQQYSSGTIMPSITSTPAHSLRHQQQQSVSLFLFYLPNMRPLYKLMSLPLQSGEVLPTTTTTTSPESPVHRPITPSFPVKEYR